MMISEEQRNSIKEWLSAGDKLAEVQRKLKEVYQLNMTYIDVRLLVLDIGAEVQEAPEPQPAAADADQGLHPAADGDDEDYDEAGEGIPGSVRLSLDRLMVPGAMASGDVVFSDGVKARWLIDRMGRFGLEPEREGYQPSEADVQMFQMELRAELQRKGYA